jgi:hypothetical protein
MRRINEAEIAENGLTVTNKWMFFLEYNPNLPVTVSNG